MRQNWFSRKEIINTWQLGKLTTPIAISIPTYAIISSIITGVQVIVDGFSARVLAAYLLVSTVHEFQIAAGMKRKKASITDLAAEANLVGPGLGPVNAFALFGLTLKKKIHAKINICQNKIRSS